jgi:signal transduction histidine kinase
MSMFPTSPTTEGTGLPAPEASRALLRRLKWITIVGAVGFVIAVDLIRQKLTPYLTSWPGRLILDATLFIGALFVFGIVFTLIERMQVRLERQNRELLALHTATQDVHADLALEKVLQRVVDQACSLLDAGYGAISVITDQNRIESFVTAGISDELRARIGPPPVGHGLLGVVLNEGQRLRIPDLMTDSRAHGFPPHHPPMHSLLAVPVVCQGPFRGNLYLAEKQGAPEFSEEDEETLIRFALTAAIAIDNAYLHQRLNTLAVAEERLRIAHEMHDGLAQVLAYVNTKAQAVKEYLRTGRPDEAAKHLDQLASAAREVYGDVRESIIGLRNAAIPGRSLGDALHDYARTWEAQHGIPVRVSVDRRVRLSDNAELQLQRIVQEALTNVRKHARARQVEVSLEQEEARVVAVVRDDGLGFNPEELGRAELPRFGLSTMRERGQSIGGTVHLDSSPGQGTRLTVEIPSPSSLS